MFIRFVFTWHNFAGASVDLRSTYQNTERLFILFLVEDSLIIITWIFEQHQAARQTKRHGMRIVC